VAITVTDLAFFLENYFRVSHYPPNEQGGLYRSSERSIQRIGLALEPWPGLPEWIANHELDAVWLHRPWKLAENGLLPDRSIFFHHAPFDEHLTLSYNPRLAGVLGIAGIEELGYKQATALPARPIGMEGEVSGLSFVGWCQQIQDVFGGHDQVYAGWQETPERVAIVGAMTDELVREAAGRGVDLYITGQYRKPAERAVQESGMAVIVVGHRRSEEWGVRALAGVLRERWLRLQVFVAAS